MSIGITLAGALGVVGATLYGLRMIQQAFQGPNQRNLRIADLSPREWVMVTVMAVGLLWLGFYPQPVLRAFSPAIESLQQHNEQSILAWRR